MPAAIPIAMVGSSSIGGAIAAHQASKGAQISSDASLKAADLAKKSNDAALKFQQDQSSLDAVRANATQQANFNQYRAHEQRLSDFGQALGLAPRNIPAYEPLPTTATAPTSAQTPAGTTPQGMPAAGNLSDPNAWMALVNDTPKLTQWVTSGLGAAAQAKPDLVSYYVGQIKGQPGAN